MLDIKTTKNSLINRVLKLDKSTKANNKPNLVMISITDNKNWRIQEHYFKNNNQIYHKDLIYDNYKKYLNTTYLNNIPVIIDNIV